jgi:hypothetical protein
MNKNIYNLLDKLNKSFDFVNHENLKNSYMSIEEEHKKITSREKQFNRRQNIFIELYKCFECTITYLKNNKDDLTLNAKFHIKDLYKLFYNSLLLHSNLTNELYEDYYFKLNTIYFKCEIPYNYKTTAEFFLQLTEHKNTNAIIFNDYIKSLLNNNIAFEPLIKDYPNPNIDIAITEDKNEADLYQDNKSYGTAHNILDLIKQYEKLPTKLKNKYKQLANHYNIKPLYNKNYFLNSLENKFYYVAFELRPTNRLIDLYSLYPHYETTYLMFLQDPSLYQPKPRPKPKQKKTYINYEDEDQYLLLSYF